ncbi:hypothetical protein OZX62_04680 [Bifidobacterium sp. ESL0690]|uniref:hypothetical protein n=1 Tax=Bifidobacterium sp. ESL0690 TaxID=2983214 RepID=UPI0023F783D4|nr:hypothetical protein [Bifidobacterium sp. ESL0690]WEV47566.1 hypothetical protein OZX62_04680 [Bifidobacterium sp. ESL0690]
MISEDIVPNPDDNKSIQIVKDDSGIMVLGDDSVVDEWLKQTGLDKNAKAMAQRAVQACGNGLQTLANTSAQSGRWVKLTKESAAQVKKYGSTGTGVVRGEHGKIISHLKFEDLTKASSLANPEMLAGAGAVMTQMALEQSMQEITDYLNEIDSKIDDLLQDQKDQTIANLMGAARMIDETKTIYDKVGVIADTTWSKVDDCPMDLASAQSYALVKIRNLVNKLADEKDAGKAEKLSEQLLEDATDWMFVIGKSIQAQDELYVIELDRVLDEQPQEVEQYKEGINAARQKRLYDIAGEFGEFSKSIHGSADGIRSQKVWHPNAVKGALKNLQDVNQRLSGFAVAIGVDADSVEIKMAPRWKDAAGKLIVDTTAGIGQGAKQIGSGAVKLGKGAGQKIGEGAGFVGDYAGQLGENIKESRDKLAEKLADERDEEAKNPKSKKASSKPNLHDFLSRRKDSGE